MVHYRNTLPSETRTFYQTVMKSLTEARLPFLLGGAYALAHYTGIRRHTKDLDLFVRPEDSSRILKHFADLGCTTKLLFPHWLGKIYHGDAFADVIFSSGNGLVDVDDEWFAHAVEGTALDMPVRICPIEEMIWSKAFVMERERYDGADIAHLMRAQADAIDWQRLKLRFGDNWRLLLSYLVLFGFIYPDEAHRVPADLQEELCRRLRSEQAEPREPGHLCRGTLLSREQFLIDIQQWDYQDARLPPHGKMSPEARARWTEAIYEEEPTLTLAPTL